MAPRSGLAAKHGIDTMAGVIDADYRGPVGVILANLSDTDFEVKVGDRIAQLIVEKACFSPVRAWNLTNSTDRNARSRRRRETRRKRARRWWLRQHRRLRRRPDTRSLDVSCPALIRKTRKALIQPVLGDVEELYEYINININTKLKKPSVRMYILPSTQATQLVAPRRRPS